MLRPLASSEVTRVGGSTRAKTHVLDDGDGVVADIANPYPEFDVPAYVNNTIGCHG